MIHVLCIVGKMNEPLCLRCYRGFLEYKAQLEIFSAIDLTSHVDNLDLNKIKKSPFSDISISSMNSNCDQENKDNLLDTYHGYLSPSMPYLELFEFPSDADNFQLTLDLGIYYYRTSSQLKILAIIEESEHLKNSSIRCFFQEIHQLYTYFICNPFCPNTLNEPEFTTMIDQCVDYYSNVLSNDPNKVLSQTLILSES